MKKILIKYKMIKNALLVIGLFFSVFGLFPQAVFATMPIISSISPNTPGTTNATVTWTTNIAADSAIEYGTTISYGSTKSDAVTTTSHNMTITGLSAGTQYNFRVKSTNGLDQVVSTNQTFTTEVAPIISNVRIAEITNSLVTVTWDTNINSYGILAYGNTSSYGQVIGNEEDYVTAHSITIAGLPLGATKHYLPRAKDINGNIWPYATDSTFTTGSPYITSFSSTASGSYGPGSNIDITANYADSAGDSLGAGSVVTVLLNNGLSIDLNNVDTVARTISGTYDVGATGSGQDITNLKVSAITSQNVCDTGTYCLTGLTMAPINISDGIIVDTTSPTFTTQYYSDSSLTTSLGNNPRLKAGTYYVKITSNEALSGTPTITIGAEGTANDITNVATVPVSGNDYIYTRTINYDVAATGVSLEDISITGTDSATNIATDVNPTNEATTAAYTDTVKPTVIGAVSPTDYANARSVSVSLVFSENMKQTVAPTVVIRKSDASAISVLGNYTDATHWAGTVTIIGTDVNGVATLEVNSASDVPGNIMDANNNSDQVLIDTINPAFTIIAGVDVGPTKTDIINVTTSDASPSSNVVNQYYGFSADNICNAGDVITTAFSSGVDFPIAGNYTNYLCVRAVDGAGNIAYQTVGQLNTDNTASIISDVSSSHADGQFKAGEVININATFSENVTITGLPRIKLQTNNGDQYATYVGGNGTSNIDFSYTVQAADYSADLDYASTVSLELNGGTIMDYAGNNATLALAAPGVSHSLGANKAIILDNTSPAINIVFPLNGNPVNINSVILFSDNEITNPQCWINSNAATNCSSGITLLSSLSGWEGINSGDYFDLHISDTDQAGNSGSDTETGIKKDTTAPTISSITSVSGYYKAGQGMDLTFNFSKAVTSVGSVSVALNSGGSCSFTVSNNASAICHYNVLAGQNNSDLDTVVSGISGIIKDSAGNKMTNTEPAARLATDYNIVVDTTSPTINSVSVNPTGPGSYGIGNSFTITVNFAEDIKLVNLNDYFRVALNAGQSCAFKMETFNNQGTCLYQVAAGDYAADLQVIGISADGTVQDRSANLMVNFTGYTNFGLGIGIDTSTPGNPTITSITSTSGYYNAGKDITVNFNFSEPVTTDGNNVSVNFDSGGSCTFAIGLASNSASCTYRVLSTENSADLEATISQLVAIRDTGNNAITNFIPAAGLKDNYDVVVDTENPNPPALVSLTSPINDVNKNAITLSGHTDEPGATILYVISDTNSGTADVSGQQIVAQGDFAITDINLSSLDGGTITVTVSQKDFAQNQSSDLTPAPTASSTVTKPFVASITSTTAAGYYNAGDLINIMVNFSEAVSSTGPVKVALNANGNYCILSQLTNESVKSCTYEVLAGDNASPLNVVNISEAAITDLQGNVMVAFSPQINLANITIDTINPSNPSVNLVDINDGNKTSVTLSGNGEDGTTAYYSINDGNELTTAVTGSVVANAGTYSTQVDLSSLDGGTITATVYLTDLADNSSSPVNDTASSSIVKPIISSITSETPSGNYNTGNPINITVNFSETLSSTQSVRVDLNTGGYCEVPQFNNASSVSCEYVIQPGDNVVSLDVELISTTGELTDQEDDLLIDFSIGTNLSVSKIFVIDTSTISLTSFTSDKPNGTYGSGTEINIIANYSEDINTTPVPEIMVTLDTGAQINLQAGPDNRKLTGVYVVGATDVSNENTLDLSVASIQSQNVCDLSDNCQVGQLVPENNNISDTSAIAVDTESPRFSNLAPDSASNVNSVTTASGIAYSISENLQGGIITIDATDDSQHFDCTLSGDFLLAGDHNQFDVTNCEGSSAIELTPGLVYSFTFSGVDLYNNQSRIYNRTDVSYMWDENDPILSDPVETKITPTSVTIEWTTMGKITNSFVDLGTDTMYSLTTIGNGETFLTNHQIIINNLSPNTKYFYRIRSIDEMNNEGINDNVGEGYEFTTASLPEISGMAVENITTTGARIVWSSDLDAFSYIDYGITESYGQIIGNEETLAKNHSITIAGLNVDTIYYFRTRTKDINGNYSLGAAGSFTTLAAGSSAPSITNIKSSIGTNSSINIDWKTSTACNGVVRYGLSKEYDQSAAENITIVAVASFATDHVVNISDLLSNATYHYSVVSYDAIGNIAISEDKVFITPALASISGVEIVNITPVSATIIWETGDPTTSAVDYGFTTSYGETVTDKTLANSHKVELANLESGKAYHVRINGLSKDSKSIFSDDYVFATNSKLAISNNKIEEITDSNATIQWTTSAETNSLVEYINKNDPEDKGVQGFSDLFTEHKVVLSGLNQGSQYEIKIKGTDVNKNSVESELFEITTDKDEQAPIISQVNTELSLINGKEDKVQSIVFWKTDEASSSQVIFNTSKGDGNDMSSQESKEDSNLSTNHVIVLTNLKPGIVYHFQVISHDKNNNIAKSEDFSLLTPQKEQSVIQLIIGNFEQTFGWMKKMKM